MRSFVQVALAVVGMALLSMAALAADAPRPNILVILCDDLESQNGNEVFRKMHIRAFVKRLSFGVIL